MCGNIQFISCVELDISQVSAVNEWDILAVLYPILQYMGNKFHISIHPCIEILPYSHFPTNILIGLYVTTIIGHMEIIANNSHVLLLNLHVHITCNGGNPYKTVFLYNMWITCLSSHPIYVVNPAQSLHPFVALTCSWNF